jgi:small-conductance mechanosensitive channel
MAAFELPFLGEISDPRVLGLLQSALILLLAYLLARIVAEGAGRLLMARARRTATEEDNELVRSLKRPLTLAVCLLGGSVAIAPLPLPDKVQGWMARALFALAVAAATVALVRAWRLLLFWWSRDPTDGREKEWARDFSPLLTKVGAVLIALFGLITILENVGVDVNSLVVSLGVGSLAVGLAAQDTLANMFAGFTLMLDRPFRLGERIQLPSGEVGDVEAIGIRATRLRTLDESLLVIPNGVLTKEKVVNLSRPTRVLTTRVEVGVAYDSDPSVVKAILRESALASPVVLLQRFGDFSLQYLLVFWVRDYVEQGLCRSEVQQEIHRRLGEAGIEIPFPVRRVIQEMRGPGDAAGDA